MEETDNHELRLAPPGWWARRRVGQEANKNFDKLDTVTKGLSDDGESLNIEKLSIGPGMETAKPEDGTDGIQAAIDALPAEGGLVQLTAGRYEASPGHQYPDSLIKITKDNVAIVGQGRASELFVPDNYQDNDGDGMRIIDIGGNDIDDPWLNEDTYLTGCLLKDIRIDGNQQNNNGDGDGNTISDANDGHNIEIYGSDNKVVNVWSVNATGDGVELTRMDGSSNADNEANLVHGCTFRDCWEQNVHIHGGTKTAISNNWLLGEVNNTCLALATGSNTETTKAVIQGNFIFGSDTDGMLLAASNTSSATGDANEIEVVSNFVWGHGGSGMYIDGRASSDITIRDNRIFNNSESAIYSQFGATDLLIRGNTIYQNQENGVVIQAETDGSGNGEGLSNLTIEDNIIRNNNQADGYFYGVSIFTDGQDIDDVSIRDNKVISTTAPVHRSSFNFKEIASGGSYSRIRLAGNDHYGTVDGAIKNQDFPFAALANNEPRIVVDVRNAMEANQGATAYHDGSGTNTEGEAQYIGGASAWKSLVDGSTIS